MLSDLNCADLCAACYAATETFDKVVDIGGVWAGVCLYDDCTAIAFRGSTYIDDWLRDFQGLMFIDATLGPVEQGFILGLRDAKVHLEGIIPLDKPIFITGHSLGAAHALLFTGLFSILRQRQVNSVVTFGSPRPGSDKLKMLLSSVPIRSYRNGNDPVTEVPPTLPGMDYCHPRSLILVDVPPPVNDPWRFMGRHHIQLYQEAMKKLCAMS